MLQCPEGEMLQDFLQCDPTPLQGQQDLGGEGTGQVTR